MSNTKLAAVALLSIVVAGCGTSSAPGGSSALADPAAPGAAEARVVIADLDTGINPYHAFYNASGTVTQSPIYPPGSPPSAVTPEVLSEFGVDAAHVITLTRTGDFAADFAADEAIWKSIKRGELYWFKGTNIIAVSFVDQKAGVVPILPEGSTHGVGTSSAALTANPEAVLLFVEQGDAGIGSDETHQFAFNHPLVDILTTSYGVSFAMGLVPAPETNRFLGTYEAVVGQGKLHFSSSGNGPGLSPFRAGAGPWWDIGVSGVEEDSSNGRTLLSGLFPDFLADFTQTLPYCYQCEDGYEQFVAGTSFSTPRAAGVASRVVLEARRALKHVGPIKMVDGLPIMVVGADGTTTISNWQIRRALEDAAFTPGLADYDPVEGVFDLGGLPINPVAPWVQVGWGVLSSNPDRGVVAEALAHLGLGGEAHAKDPGYCDFQTKIMQERMLYWDNLANTLDPIGSVVISPGTPVPGSPESQRYIFCGSSLPPLPAS